MNCRNTNQKKIIMDTLSSVRTHPTIYELYDLVKEKDSSIGMATVYRNVKKFVDDGTVYIIKTKTGQARYDFYGEHAHFECLKCGKLIDLFDDEIFNSIKKKMSNNNVEVKNCNILLDGYCKDCC